MIFHPVNFDDTLLTWRTECNTVCGLSIKVPEPSMRQLSRQKSIDWSYCSAKIVIKTQIGKTESRNQLEIATVVVLFMSSF